MIFNDYSENFDYSFQDPATKTMEGIYNLHDEIMYYIIIIFIIVNWMLISILYKFYNNPIKYKYFNHGSTIEFIWTIIPAIILIAIALPSFKLLYLIDEVIDPYITIKVIGNQWYWSYEYSDYLNESLNFDSYLIPTSDLTLGQLRLLEVDNRVILPINTNIRFIITSTDVIHSFSIPSLGIKLDAIPGRLNEITTNILREGVFYGVCSELCGVYHDAMPIVIESVTLENYLNWLNIQFNGINTDNFENPLLT